ncbi:hypothetical protein SR882_10395 [Guyparkeria halophila]|uniref:Zinc ribbon domain-containing protein n=1 Tax=Guyparkeria halophila TaxID=47960 RepID=A0ABZ0YXM8_9GAMM|nr:hypothetical protein [Guyparkeria halophila]WQH16159.1 hypothetical protein SR882_10395 [Guyparkeria halophila]
MTQKTCPKCGYVNQAANPEDPTDSCPSCGVVYAKAKPHTKERPRKRPVDPEATRGIGSIILFVFLGVGIAWLFVGGEDEPRPAIEVAEDAYGECMTLVERQLKAPGTADFALMDYRVAHAKGSQYLLQSHVDAENGFGAKLRLDYLCDIEVSGQQAKATKVHLIGR